MIRQTRTASRQIDELLDDYMIKERDGAIDNLNRAVREALAAIEAKPSAGRSHRAFADRGFSWIEIHRYWFAYLYRPATCGPPRLQVVSSVRL